MSHHARISFWWDDQAGDSNGWYAQEERYNDETGQYDFHDDSMKVWFPINLDSFKKNQGEKVRAALRKAFPDHEINWMVSDFRYEQALWLLRKGAEAIRMACENALPDEPETWGEVESVAKEIDCFLGKEQEGGNEP